MNAAETIQAAIEKLESLRDDAALGPWKVANDEWLLALVAGDGYSIAIDFDQENAELIVTLHRTIDAQLAILRHAFARAQSKVSTGGNERSVWSYEIDAENLARAVLGEDAS